MADALVSIALEKLIHILGQQLSLFAGASGELEKLGNSLQSIHDVLADAESRQVFERGAQLWLSRLRHVAYDIDNVLNEWQISVLEKDDDGGGDAEAANTVLAPACLPSPYACLDRTVSRYSIARSIKEIRERLDQIAKDKDQFNTSQIRNYGGDRSSWSRPTTTSHMEEEVIGREDDKDAVISRLVSGSSGDDGQVQVIAIVGIGGLGKTTLARKIYHDDKVQNHFKQFLWVCVSEDFGVKRLTKTILEQVKRTSTSLSQLEMLQNELLEALRGKHFLLVLDDLWNEDKEKWKRLQASLKSGAPSSRILVTTRLQKVATFTVSAAYIHDLKGLSNDHSWTLFSYIAFDGREAQEYSKLESVGREIVNKCKGVPLSITVMGSVMNSKQTVEDWQNILGSKMWSLPEAENKILPALWLSYNNLPPHLKQCFVYCSIYEKDEEMHKDNLVKLWIAQGFVASEGNREIEDIGVGYFDDLVAWSLFQEVREDEEGKITCKMHDLLHDLAEFIMRDETYIYRSENSNLCSANVRHASLILSENDPSIPILPRGGKMLRTLFLDGDYKIDTVLLDLFRQARFLMTLVFSGYDFKILPKTIGKLKHLRYLDLSNSWIVELPNVIGKMKQLKYLDLSNSALLDLPNGIEELKQLRHLDVSGSNIVQLPDAIGRMKQLRHLDLSRTRIVELPESLNRLHNLQTLNLNSCSELKKLPRGIGGMVGLRYFKIEDTDDLECLPTGMGRITSLRSLSKFIVGDEGGCGIDELQRLNSLQGDIEIIHLERVLSGEEARKAELWNKPHLHKLVLKMSGGDEEIVMSGRDAEIERMNSVLEGLRPHASIEQLQLYCHGRSSKLPSWMEDSSFSKLTELTVEGFICCEQNLPGLGKLPNLKSLEIRDVGVKKMDHELYYGSNSNDAFGTSVAAFPKLEELWLQDMQDLEEWALISEADANVMMPSLRFLEISNCRKLEGLPRHLAKAPLKQLGISHCPRIKGTGCSSFPLLEEFSLRDSSEFHLTGLPELPNLKKFFISNLRNETFGDGGWDRLAELQKLEIEDCYELKSLPDGLTQLQLLEDLRILGCEVLDLLPKGLGQLKKLKSLEIKRAYALTRLPDSLAELESLEQLDIDGLQKLQSLPKGLGQLNKLKSLNIWGAEALIYVPNSLGQLESLEDLRMDGLEKLQSLPEGLGQLKQLKSLTITGAEELICLPNSLVQLESLESIRLDSLKKLESLPEGLGQLKKLESLEITDVEALICLPNSLGQLESLESLGIKGQNKLESLPEGLGQLKKLKSLAITDAEALICLPNSLGQLESLESLGIKGLKKLESLPEGLGQLKKLKSLKITDAEALICLPNSLGQLESLKSLEIYGLKKLESLPEGLGQLKKLESLEITDAEALVCLPNSLGQLESLRSLEIYGLKKLESLPEGLGQLNTLKSLIICRAEALTCLPESLGQCESLEISGCKKLKSVPRRMGQLKSLHIGYLEALTSPPDTIGRLKSLERLTISRWEELESLPRWLWRLKSLKYLRIYDCTALRSLPHGVQDLPLLRELSIFSCPVLSERCKREGGEDWPKISRIPHVYIDGRMNY